MPTQQASKQICNKNRYLRGCSLVEAVGGLYSCWLTKTQWFQHFPQEQTYIPGLSKPERSSKKSMTFQDVIIFQDLAEKMKNDFPGGMRKKCCIKQPYNSRESGSSIPLRPMQLMSWGHRPSSTSANFSFLVKNMEPDSSPHQEPM